MKNSWTKIQKIKRRLPIGTILKDIEDVNGPNGRIEYYTGHTKQKTKAQWFVRLDYIGENGGIFVYCDDETVDFMESRKI